MRKQNLAQLLARRPDGIFVAPIEQGGSVPTCFGPHATWGWTAWCRSGPIAPIVPAAALTGSKVKNPKHPAMARVKDSFSRRLNSV
jgi:bifunctional non-homologous end joining protein LigD